MIRFDTTLGALISALYDAFSEDLDDDALVSLGVAMMLRRLNS